MKYMTTYIAALAILFTGVNAQAQDQTKDSQKNKKANQQVEKKSDHSVQVPKSVPHSIRMSAMTSYDSGVRVSQVIGLPVKNLVGKEIGTVHDLVMDQDGQIRYAAMSRGGVLGIGDKLFAIPACCTKIKTGEEGNAKSMYLLFNVSEEKLASSPGFDQNDWPEVGTTEYWVTVDKHYEAEIDREMARKMEKKKYMETSGRKPNSDLDYKSKKVRYPNSGGIPKDAKKDDGSDK